MRYRRSDVGGGTYFFTVNLADRTSRLLTERVDRLRDAVRAVKGAHPFEILAWVVFPDHLHAIWVLPRDDADFSLRWSLIKAGFSRSLPNDEKVSIARQRKRERGIWQRRFWEHLIRNDTDRERHVNYIHFNPVKHGYVSRASEWPNSSIHRYMVRGWLTRDWACEPIELERHGERE